MVYSIFLFLNYQLGNFASQTEVSRLASLCECKVVELLSLISIALHSNIFV